MTLYPAPILVNGATHPAEVFRMLVRDLSLGSEGITQGDDLKVTQLSTPGGSVQISDGSGIVRGRANPFQGSYSACNVGSATVTIAPTAGSPRSDMVILRIEDPQYEGTRNPAVDPIAYFQVISNVSSSATAIPDGRTGIPLARIDIPASTATITDAMIKDVRKVANPRRERTLWTQSPASPSTAISGTSGTYSYFTTAAGWNIPIPSWASVAKIRFDIGGLRLSSGAVYGDISATFGASLAIQAVSVDDSQTSGRRYAHLMGDTLTIPSAYRGTTQLLRARGRCFVGNAATMLVDTGSTLIADVTFEEAPR
ncbi:hypothetical protein [Streptomyces sp. WAC08241]|uniref:hypothetical protein n=1 Tax=Streptomyces sp. WAC08241 TaxID=2487421 RepID=UPI000F76ACA8|nr:hypothetical protein [Streptomyces sp. WAC08241]RSS43831.1 hypothetical protein EF906_08770 [Streptomyces sp. WAC08241]